MSEGEWDRAFLNLVKRHGSEHVALAKLENMEPKEVKHVAAVTNPRQAGWGS